MKEKHKKIELLLILSCVVFSVCSCKDNKKKQEEATKIVNEWIGKEIRFPENVTCYIFGKDTLPELCNEHFQKEFKILLYVDSTGCSDCRLKLLEWKQLMEEANNLFYGKVGFLLFFQPKDVKEMRYLFIRNRFNYPVIIDKKGDLNNLNRFPKAIQYQCFLLNSNNKVLMIGNPVLNRSIWELYKEQIVGGKENGSEQITSVSVEKLVHDYGTIGNGTSNIAVFTITNTGNHPLIINHVSASCDCTSMEWDKQPVIPEQKANIRIEMKPEDTGYFNKTIEVYCNADKSPIRLRITGTTID